MSTQFEKPVPDAHPAHSPRKTDDAGKKPAATVNGKAVPEVGGPSGPEPTRYGDWERKGRCIDF